MRETGKQKEAIVALRALLPEARKALGVDAQRTLGLQLQLASALQLDGDYEAALAESRDAVARHARVIGERHPQTLYAWNQLGVVENKFGNAEAARAAIARAYEADSNAVRPGMIEGRIEALAGNHAAAIKAFERAARHDSDYLPEILPIVRGQGARHILPTEPSRFLSIGCTPHFFYDSDGFIEKV